MLVVLEIVLVLMAALLFSLARLFGGVWWLLFGWDVALAGGCLAWLMRASGNRAR